MDSDIEILHLDCDCSDYSHIVRISAVKEQISASSFIYALYFDVGLDRFQPFWKRVAIAWAYIFGLTPVDKYLYGSAEISEPIKIIKLRDMLNLIIKELL